MPAAAPNPRNVERYCRTHELLNRTTTRRNFLLTGSFAILWLLLAIEPLEQVQGPIAQPEQDLLPCINHSGCGRQDQPIEKALEHG